MAYVRKTRDRWDLETNYGYGWEVEDCEYSVSDARRMLKDYRNNVQAYGRGMVRLVKRREKK